MNPIIIKRELKNKQLASNIFLPTNKIWKSNEAQKISVWESGEKQLLFKRIIVLIKQAKECICLQSFLIQDTQIVDSLVEASKKGVRVFVMDSAEARLNKNGVEEDEHHSVTEYKEMLNEKFRYCFVHRQASNFHAKFILIDPKTKAQGVMFTGNFNIKPFKENPELGVELSKKQVEDLFKIFIYHFWEFATDEQTEKEEFVKVRPSKAFPIPSLNEALITSPDKELSNLKVILLDKITKANQSIIFSTFGFDIRNDVSQAILSKLQAGLSVTVFCRPREKAIYKNIEVLSKHGAKVYCHELIHAKSIVVDTKWGAIFSANFETHGMDESFEVGVVLSSTQKDDLLKIYQSWEDTFPYEYYSARSFSDIPLKYSQIKGRDLVSYVVLGEDKQASSNKTVEELNELIEFVELKVAPKPSKAKRIIQHKEIRFKEFKQKESTIIESITSEVDLVEYEEVIKKKKTEKIIKHQVLLFKQTIKDIEEVIVALKKKGLPNYKIYMN